MREEFVQSFLFGHDISSCEKSLSMNMVDTRDLIGETVLQV